MKQDWTQSCSWRLWLCLKQQTWYHFDSAENTLHTIVRFSLGFLIIQQPKHIFDFQLKQLIGARVIWPTTRNDVVGEFQNWNTLFPVKMACANQDLSLVLAFRATNKPSKEICKIWTKSDLQNLPLAQLLSFAWLQDPQLPTRTGKPMVLLQLLFEGNLCGLQMAY